MSKIENCEYWIMIYMAAWKYKMDRQIDTCHGDSNSSAVELIININRRRTLWITLNIERCNINSTYIVNGIHVFILPHIWAHLLVSVDIWPWADLHLHLWHSEGLHHSSRHSTTGFLFDCIQMIGNSNLEINVSRWRLGVGFKICTGHLRNLLWLCILTTCILYTI